MCRFYLLFLMRLFGMCRQSFDTVTQVKCKYHYTDINDVITRGEMYLMQRVMKSASATPLSSVQSELIVAQ